MSAAAAFTSASWRDLGGFVADVVAGALQVLAGVGGVVPRAAGGEAEQEDEREGGRGGNESGAHLRNLPPEAEANPERPPAGPVPTCAGAGRR